MDMQHIYGFVGERVTYCGYDPPSLRAMHIIPLPGHELHEHSINHIGISLAHHHEIISNITQIRSMPIPYNGIDYTKEEALALHAEGRLLPTADIACIMVRWQLQT
jgi:hypothetical protein